MRGQSVASALRASAWHGGERRLQRVRAALAAEGAAARERDEAARISSGSQRERSCSSSSTGRPCGVDAGMRARRLQLHQRDEAMHLAFPRHQAGEDAAEAKGLVAERRRIQSSPASPSSPR
jgi:hypothetical protein